MLNGKKEIKYKIKKSALKMKFTFYELKNVCN